MSKDSPINDPLADAINDHCLKAILRLYTPQAVLVAPGGIGEGREQIATFYGHMFEGFPDVRATPWRKITSEGVTLLEWTLTGTHLGPFPMPGGWTRQGTGRRVVVRTCSTATMDGDLMASHHFYFDQLELFTSLGVHLTRDE